MAEEHITMGGKPFDNKELCIKALDQRGLIEDFEPICYEGGGYIGVPKKAPKELLQTNSKAKTKKPKKTSSLGKLVKCRVYRSNVDPDNRDLPIDVCVNSLSNKKIFWPGEEVELREAHINVLKDSVEETRILIPPESGVYASKDPLTVARGFYPNMQATVNPMDNMITMTSRIPNYLIETIS